VSYGFSDWRTTEDGVRFRRAGPRATFFMRSSVRAIEVPLAASPAASPDGVQVDIIVDGHAAQRVMLNNEDYRAVRINAPAPRRRFWRVDLRVTPARNPRAVRPNSSDEGNVGVAVGKISVEVQQKDPGKP